MAVKVSFIMPVYNNEAVLEAAIKSVLAQEGAPFELILINDGSTDSSGEVCRREAAGDERIKYIEKENGGVSDARNRGLERAEGEWVGFIDGDDLYSKNMLRLCAPYMSADNDIIMMSWRNFYGDGSPAEIADGGVRRLDAGGVRRLAYYTMCAPNAKTVAEMGFVNLRGVTSCLMRLDIIRTLSLSFTKGMALGEDAELKLKYLSACKRAVCLGQALYFYRRAGTSLTNRYNPEIESALEKELDAYSAVCKSCYGGDEMMAEYLSGAEINLLKMFCLAYVLNPKCELTREQRAEKLNAFTRRFRLREAAGGCDLALFDPMVKSLGEAALTEDPEKELCATELAFKAFEGRNKARERLKRVLSRLGLMRAAAKVRAMLRG